MAARATLALNAALCRIRVLFIVLLLLLRGAGAVYTTLAAGPNFGILFKASRRLSAIPCSRSFANASVSSNAYLSMWPRCTAKGRKRAMPGFLADLIVDESAAPIRLIGLKRSHRNFGIPSRT